LRKTNFKTRHANLKMHKFEQWYFITVLKHITIVAHIYKDNNNTLYNATNNTVWNNTQRLTRSSQSDVRGKKKKILTTIIYKGNTKIML